MIDSKDSMSLSPVSRRKLLSATATVPLLPTISPVPRDSVPDPILPLWHQWQLHHRLASQLCRHWQKMESFLVRTVGFPQVSIPSPDGHPICAQSHQEIDRALAGTEETSEMRAALHVEFASRQARWDTEAERIGFDDAKRQECDAWAEEAETARTIFRTKAATLAGVEIKVALMVQLCAAYADDPEFPLPQLRSTLADVKRLRRALEALRA